MTSAIWASALGVESTHGTPVTPTKMLKAVSIRPSPRLDSEAIRLVGTKYSRVIGAQKFWTAGSYEGACDFNSMVYILSSAIKETTPTQVGSTTAYTWTFEPSISSEDTFVSYTCRSGYGSNCIEVPYMVFSTLNIEASRRENTFNVSGDILGQAPSSATMPSSPTVVGSVLMNIANADVYMDNTYTGIGTTKIETLSRVGLRLDTRYLDQWYVDSSVSGFTELVEGESPVSIELLIKAKQSSISTLLDLTEGVTKFLRLNVQGPQIDTGVYYDFTLDMCGVLGEINSFEDSNGIYAIRYTMYATYDGDWGKALEFSVTNELSAL